MEQRLITLKNGQIKAIYEYFAKLLNEDGKNAAFSYMLYKNVEILNERYADIIAKMYDEKSDVEFQNFRNKGSELVTKYADRNEQGEILLDTQGQPIIREMLAEFNTDREKLTEEFKPMLDNREQRIAETISMLETTYELNLYVTKIENMPNNTMPAIVGIFGI